VLGDLFGVSLKTVRVAKKNLDIHINQKVMTGELVLYPQMYAFLQQLRVDYSGRTEGGPLSNVQSLTQSRSLCFGLTPVATRRSSQWVGCTRFPLRPEPESRHFLRKPAFWFQGTT